MGISIRREKVRYAHPFFKHNTVDSTCCTKTEQKNGEERREPHVYDDAHRQQIKTGMQQTTSGLRRNTGAVFSHPAFDVLEKSTEVC